LRQQELYAAMGGLLVHRESDTASKFPHDDLAREPLRSIDEHDAQLAAPSRDEALRLGRLILVAEDNPASQKLILRQLALLGFAADVVGNGRHALEACLSGSYALLFSDLHMPEMDGHELTEAIRAQEDGARRLPIVALTAGSLEDELVSRATSFDGYLSKPLHLADLKAVLESWLPGIAPKLEVRAPDIGSGALAPSSLDVRILESLVGSDPSIVQEFLEDFRLSVGRVAPELAAACRELRARQAGELAHRLMATSRAVGALALGDLCERMEAASKAGNADALNEMLPGFAQEITAVNDCLDSLLATSE
jgi:CheY-like chemotaxis protein/HPt (histidine-containing phosphotransfer) domain-containing protein